MFRKRKLLLIPLMLAACELRVPELAPTTPTPVPEPVPEIVRLAWDAPTENVDGSALTDLAGYVVYHGPSSGAYSASEPTTDPNPTHDLILPPGRYFVCVRAVNSKGTESVCSNEVEVVVPSGS